MKKLIYITGGARSGKSSFAQEMALGFSENPVYLATAKKWDGDFQKRIDRHVADRDERWTNLEEERYPSQLDLEGRVVMLDCVTLWLTNIFLDLNHEVEESLEAFKKEIDALCEKEATLIIVSNEIGMGVHAETPIGRKFTDLQGWANQYVARKADEAYLMVSGLSQKLK